MRVVWLKRLLPPPGFLIFLVLWIWMSAARAQTSSPVSVIFDTDMGPDYDDVGAIAILHAFADNGECRILATMGSNQHKRIAAVLNAFNTYFGKPEIPVGVVRGNAVNIPAHQKWDSVIAENYPHALKNNDEAWDALALYRKLLAAQPDHSVTIVTVGFLTNMSNLLQSAPDQYSSLDGEQLVQKKVRQLVCMAGRFGGEYGKFREFNVMKDSAASKEVFDHWPTPILFSGFEIGAHIHTGLPLIHDSSIRHSPVKDVFAISIPLDPNDASGRMSWDETAVFVAVRGYADFFDVADGKIICYPDGSNGWDASGTRDRYLVQKMPVNQIEMILNGLIAHPPKKNHN